MARMVASEGVSKIMAPIHDNSDRKWRDICLNCYLSGCHLETRLRRYCPINAAQKHNVPAPVVLQLTRTTPVNRRWQFLEAVKQAAG